MEFYQICTLVPAPPEDDQDCPEDSLHLGVVRSKTWPTGHTLKIKLIGGNDEMRQQVEKYAREWTKYANIRMAFIEDPSDAEIRVTFKKGGSWSLVGRDCLTRLTEPTMNLGCFGHGALDYEVARTVYHEFGHALGCVHEHQNPIQGIRWDKERVYSYYAQSMGWDRVTVDRNILTKYTDNATQFSCFDIDSIMLYHVPKELTLDGSSILPNNDLSPTDIDFIRRVYPGLPEAPVPPPPSPPASPCW
ncbi:hypothetical protein F4680DRAFT_411304 [Xylaria scruposa]|nr:hypothetical protein F4680DRAFT_411304 [Xylaria scruposa]